MRSTFALVADRLKDDANRGPVRAERPNFLSLPLGVTAVALALLFSATFVTATPQNAAPNATAVSQAIASYFASLPNYQPGDLISRSQIERVLAMLNEAGAPVPQASEIADRGLADNSFMVQGLSSPTGKAFLRKLARDPGAFTHLDRLSSIPGGEKLIRDLIADRDGDKMIQYLATTKGGQNMGRMMAGINGGIDLNKPTHRIYTVDELIEAINVAYASR